MSKKHLMTADILLPKGDFESWSVIACDQYTSEPEYWRQTAQNANGKASAFNIVLPEVYLGDDDEAKIAKINENMKQYMENDVFNLYENTMVYIERTLKDGRVRKGILGLIDLEDYSYVKGANSPIRAT